MTALFVLSPHILFGQELEPRSLANVPVRMNYIVFGYGYSSGNILLDPVLSIEDLNARVHGVFAAYVRAIDVFGLSGKIDVTLPFAGGDYHALFEGQEESLSLTGFGDPRVRLSVNFLGAPALRADEFENFRQKTIVGASLQVFVPIGQYDSSEILNLGSNRWTFRSQVGLSHAVGEWFLEAYTGFCFFTRNPDFNGGNELIQRPLYVLRFHAI